MLKMDISSINLAAARVPDTAMLTSNMAELSAQNTSADIDQNSLVARQFSAIMSGGAAQSSLISDVTASGVGNPVSLDRINASAQNSDLLSDVVAAPATMGDGILAGMQNLSDNFKKVHADVVRTLDNTGDMNLSDMLKLQMHLSEMSFQWDAFSKVVTKSTQNLEQLLKLQ
jgi:type III secretion system YscI/HrpB-like protein